MFPKSRKLKNHNLNLQILRFKCQEPEFPQKRKRLNCDTLLFCSISSSSSGKSFEIMVRDHNRTTKFDFRLYHCFRSRVMHPIYFSWKRGHPCPIDTFLQFKKKETWCEHYRSYKLCSYSLAVRLFVISHFHWYLHWDSLFVN